MKKLTALVLALVLFTGTAGAAFAAGNPMDYRGTIRIASQNVNETIILAWMAKLLIDGHTGLDTTINTEFAGSAVLHQAMAADEIDLYPSWTGTQLTGILRYEGESKPSDETFAMVKEGFEKNFNMTWTRPVGFNNTYVMAVKAERAEKYGLKKASDLADHGPEWKLGGDENFDTRLDGYPGWSECYGITFRDVLPMQYAMMYMALAQDEVDVIAAYSTDSRIKKLNLVLLEDDKSFFPDYSAAFVLPIPLAEKYPGLVPVVEKISGAIDEQAMAAMNLAFDEGEDPEDIAAAFLRKKGFIQ
ncbi:MAG: glycine betaine ABC transporter substrate-binding protein [Aminobacteriaceae bacterium]